MHADALLGSVWVGNISFQFFERIETVYFVSQRNYFCPHYAATSYLTVLLRYALAILLPIPKFLTRYKSFSIPSVPLIYRCLSGSNAI